jgi:molybdopterin synthase catalytic subunit
VHDVPLGGDLPAGDDWIAAGEGVLPTSEALAWAVRPGCGAVVTFCGTVRDHAEGRHGVTHLDYEAYLEQVGPRLDAVARAARERWPDLGRVALLHRLGRLTVGEVSVVVVVSAPHRGEAFDAARFCIDAVKESVPIWKRETWAEGSDWGLCAHDVRDVDGARPGADEAGSGRGGGTGVPTADGGPAPVSAPVEPV